MANIKACMPLKNISKFVKGSKRNFAQRCETTVDYLKLIIFGVRSCTAKLAIDMIVNRTVL